MLSQSGFDQWCHTLNLSEEAKSLISRVRASPPARRVKGFTGNVSGRYPSQKMGVTIQFESHRGELAAIYDLEHDPETLEYYDQPPPIKLLYRSKNERPVGVIHTPDFFVLRCNSAGWEECKTAAELIQLAERMPNRYTEQNGRWCCPPGESYAESLGCYYRLRSSNQINWTYQRNLQFLEDYLRADGPLVEQQNYSTVLGLFDRNQAIVLSELLNRTRAIGLTADTVFALIATGHLYVDLSGAALCEPERVQVYQDRAMAEIFSRIAGASVIKKEPGLLFVNTSVGTRISWDGQVWTIVNLGSTATSLLADGGIFADLPNTLFEELVRQGKIKGVSIEDSSVANAGVKRVLSEASPSDLQAANRRYQAIWTYLQGEGSVAAEVSERTWRRWLSSYRAAEARYGCGYIGLLPRQHQRGNRRNKLSEETLEVMQRFIEQDYESLKQKTKFQVHASLSRECRIKGLPVPSYRTFSKAVKLRPRAEQIRKRRGKRAAYQNEDFYWELETTTPRHGDRPFEIAHIDHTELDVELVSSLTGGNLGRPWATFLTDTFSRRLLSVYLTFDEPSYRSCMMALRGCVRRHARLPQILVVDGGPEFASVYFETLLAWYEVIKKQRPGGKARFGSVCERLFGTVNTRFINNLMGNTQLMRCVRQVTKEVNPKTHAIWTLARLFERLCEWAYEVYDTIEHPALGQCPREAFEQGMLRSGQRSHRLIPYDENFRMLTLPSAGHGLAKVTPGKGVKLKYIYYWSNAFRDPAVENENVPVRYDPHDAGVVYAFVNRRWVQCLSEHYAAFQGRSEKEVRAATEELRQRYRLHARATDVTARKLADFLTSVEAEEALTMQRLRDAEMRSIFRVVDGRVSSSSPGPVQPNDSAEPESIAQGLKCAAEVADLAALEIYEEY